MTGTAPPPPRTVPAPAGDALPPVGEREASFAGTVHAPRNLLLHLTARVQQLVPWSHEPDHRAVRVRQHLARLARRLYEPAARFHPTGIRHELALLAERLAALAARRLISDAQYDELTALLGEISRALPGRAARRPPPGGIPGDGASPPD